MPGQDTSSIVISYLGQVTNLQTEKQQSDDTVHIRRHMPGQDTSSVVISYLGQVTNLQTKKHLGLKLIVVHSVVHSGRITPYGSHNN